MISTTPLALAAHVLIMLHQLDGNVLWIETGQLQIIKTFGCDGRAGAVVRVGGREICVQETADEIRAKMQPGKGKR